MDVVINATTLTLILTSKGITGAGAGFMLVFAGNITWNVNWMLINLRQIELKGVSLERTTEYRLLEREDGYTLNPNDPTYTEAETDVADSWPKKGDIEVKDLKVRYGPDMPDILHGVSFSVKSGERIGIVGATGGGKSTLAKAFFSFVDITNGSIRIDGKDIKSVPLSKVRSKLGIIAQDPILLSGSLRLNLDIEGKYTDEELYDALHQVQLLKRQTSSERLVDVDTQENDVGADSAGSVDGSTVGSETVVGALTPKEEGQKNIFANLDSEIKSGGEK